jgi:plastocyanin
MNGHFNVRAEGTPVEARALPDVHDRNRRCLKGLVALVLVFATGCDSREQTIQIIAEDFHFTPSKLQLSAKRPIRLRIANQGRERHVFKSPLLTHHIGESAGTSSSLPVFPNQKVETVIRTIPGVYIFYCAIHGHAGMSGTIIVE